MSGCFVPGCKSRSKGHGQRLLSVPNKNPQMLERWSQAIGRLDKPLTPNSKVCSLHFAEQDIIKNDEFTVHGERVLIPRMNWKLKPEAVPSIFPGVEKEDSSSAFSTPGPLSAAGNRPNLLDASVPPGEIAAYILVESDSDEGKSHNSSSGEECAPEASIQVAIYQPANFRVHLPADSWKLISPDGVSSETVQCAEVVIIDDYPVVRKSTKINFRTKTIDFRVFKCQSPVSIEFVSLETINETLRRIHQSNICQGVSSEQRAGREWAIRGGTWENGAWRTKECLHLVEPPNSASVNRKEASAERGTVDTMALCPNCSEWKRSNPPSDTSGLEKYERKKTSGRLT